MTNFTLSDVLFECNFEQGICPPLIQLEEDPFVYELEQWEDWDWKCSLVEAPYPHTGPTSGYKGSAGYMYVPSKYSKHGDFTR